MIDLGLRITEQEQSPMKNYATGDVIEHKDLPGFRMRVRETAPCETDAARPEPHLTYRITDPEGNEDWLCAYDVRRVE